MSLTNYEGSRVICKEIKNNQQYWETLDGNFGVWLEGLTFKKNAKEGDLGYLHYWMVSTTCGLWRVGDK